MPDIPSLERRLELRQLAEGVTSVDDAKRVIEEQGLRADPGENTSVFYYGDGVKGAEALTTHEGFVRLEQTERGYFLSEVTQKLTRDGVIDPDHHDKDANKALFGDYKQGNPGEWGKASQELAENTKGNPVVFHDPARSPEKFKNTAFFNAELPALSASPDVKGLTSLSYTSDKNNPQQGFAAASSFTPVTPAFATDRAYGLNETQMTLMRVGGESAADTLHALGGDFGAVEIAAPAPAPALAAPARAQDLAATRTVAPRAPSPSPDRTPQISHGGARR